MAPREKNGEKFRNENEQMALSSIGMNYFANREKSLISGEDWLEGRRKDDNIEGLWRIHDKLYNLESFIKKHPGGSDWLILTKGTDITEAFETHHIKGIPEQLLSRYFVKEATSPRLSPFTFNDDGFYRTLKRKIANELPKIPSDVIQQSKLFADITVSVYLLLCVMVTFSESYLLGILAGYVLTLNVIISHNFIHQKNNLRMYYFDLSMMSSRDFRITHVVSHHLYPNTLNDIEINMFEPVMYFLPQKKTLSQKYVSWICALLVFPFLSVKGYFSTLLLQRKLRINTFIPWVTLILTYYLSGQEFLVCLKMFIWIILWGSLTFNCVGKTAAHHHPDIFHDGDVPRPKEDMDFGVYQLDSVGDRPNITGSPYLVLTNFGDHALHHLFPTLDHGVLDDLYPIFLETCIEFGVEWRLFSSVELVKGALRQLARDKPNDCQPEPLKKKCIAR